MFAVEASPTHRVVCPIRYVRRLQLARLPYYPHRMPRGKQRSLLLCDQTSTRRRRVTYVAELAEHDDDDETNEPCTESGFTETYQPKDRTRLGLRPRATDDRASALQALQQLDGPKPPPREWQLALHYEWLAPEPHTCTRAAALAISVEEHLRPHGIANLRSGWRKACSDATSWADLAVLVAELKVAVESPPPQSCNTGRPAKPKRVAINRSPLCRNALSFDSDSASKTAPPRLPAAVEDVFSFQGVSPSLARKRMRSSEDSPRGQPRESSLASPPKRARPRAKPSPTKSSPLPMALVRLAPSPPEDPPSYGALFRRRSAPAPFVGPVADATRARVAPCGESEKPQISAEARDVIGAEFRGGAGEVLVNEEPTVVDEGPAVVDDEPAGAVEDLAGADEEPSADESVVFAETESRPDPLSMLHAAGLGSLPLPDAIMGAKLASDTLVDTTPQPLPVGPTPPLALGDATPPTAPEDATPPADKFVSRAEEGTCAQGERKRRRVRWAPDELLCAVREFEVIEPELPSPVAPRAHDLFERIPPSLVRRRVSLGSPSKRSISDEGSEAAHVAGSPRTRPILLSPLARRAQQQRGSSRGAELVRRLAAAADVPALASPP